MKFIIGLLIGIAVVVFIASVWGGIALVVLNACGVINISWLEAFAPLILGAVLYVLGIAGLISSS
jgi:hypothetical protein